ncbi:ORC-CDC6 family AAA ATPase [Paraglaciecola arctica]|uniref:Uncharacterized protein n=1 Tax=Paraglaciecola arctica BSs20135 TaxID=493475 RepID=K6YS25_9ALTE|nr:hypothetical protein [Paraglaciecola arctica]GAC19483.1 hypothetical protein GARC_2517 [Paraglaciecola arctica BSs20135]
MSSSFKNAFEASNARDFTSHQLVNEFIWTDSFSDLLYSTKNQMVLGSRGSGKTALIKMLSHQNLRKLSVKVIDNEDNEEFRQIEEAKKVIREKSFIATYVPLKVEWINSLENYEGSKEAYFTWSLNLATCARLLDTIISCTEEYIEGEVKATLMQRKICKQLSILWTLPKIINNFSDFRKELEIIEYRKNLIFNKESMGIELGEEDKMLGISFHGSLFAPFTIATKTIANYLDIPESSKWVLCLDEAEFLAEVHHQILNTHMRSANDIFFKITTMPYRHHTLSTTVEANINVGHDLEYIYIDKLGTINMNQTTSDARIEKFATKLFENRLKQFTKIGDISLEGLVGLSKLSQDTTKLTDNDELLKLIDSHCNPATKERAKRLYKTDINRFNDEISRKLRGILLLRDEFHNRVGSSNTPLYSGKSIISRCSDGNPRRLFRLFNHLLNGNATKITPETQSKRIKSFSYSELEVIKFEKGGKNSFDFLNKIGSFFKERTLETKLGSDLPQAIKLKNSIEDQTWEAIKSAVDLGLMYPVMKKDSNHKNLFPIKEGTFCLANCLAPHFNLFPRVGKAIDLFNVMTPQKGNKQLGLFSDE